MVKGLNSQQAAQALKTVGYNELPTARAKNVGQIAYEVMKEPMFVLLLACATLYLLLGDYTEGTILLCSVFVIISITFFQHQRTEKALDTLRELAAPRALVIRDNQKQFIAGREIVPDDLVLLQEGDRIPADGWILNGEHLMVDESLLTGESVPVRKTGQGPGIAAKDQQESRVYSGTLVVQGKGLLLVSATGLRTEFGKIGQSLQGIRQEQTRMQQETKQLVGRLFVLGVLLSIMVVLAFYFTRGDFIQAVLNGLAAAMAMLPEEFPVVFTVFLAIGAWRLSRQNVLSRTPSAIETLGSATVLCSDKTGTITQNKMEVISLFVAGAWHDRADFQHQAAAVQEVLQVACGASQKEAIDPMELALVSSYQHHFPKGPHLTGWVKAYPLHKDLFAMTMVYQSGAAPYRVCCKGAPEAVLSLCRLEEAEKSRLLDEVQVMAEKGQRILAVAQAIWDSSDLPESQEGFVFTFTGFVGFEDPIRPEVPQAIQECKAAGVKVIMITGDYPSTARSIARQAGMGAHDEVLTGADLQKLSGDELQARLASVRIFARIIPEQKLQIIKALRANGEVVAMTGDGVNDAPALRAADIGVAMGKKGTDVARASADLILLDDNFSSIVSAIRAGRRIYDNLQKAMAYIIAIHIPIIGLTLLPAFFSGLPILLMPLHIVFMELIIDPVCSLAFESEREEIGIMNRPPRAAGESFFGLQRLLGSMFRGVFLLVIVLAVYFFSLQEGHTEGEIRSVAFTALILGNLFLILTTLSKTRQVFSVLREKNTALRVILLAALSLLALLLTVPTLQAIFSFTYPGIRHFSISIIAALVLLVTLEFIKYFRTRRMGTQKTRSS